MSLSSTQFDLVETDDELRSLARGAEIVFAIGTIGADPTAIRFSDGAVSRTDLEKAEFTVAFEPENWQALLNGSPREREQHPLVFLDPRGKGMVSGSHESFAQHLHILRRMLEVLRGSVPPTQVPDRPRRDSLAHVSGEYHAARIGDWGRCDVYVERAGSGQPVLLLHTAGADGRQYHGLMRDERLLSSYELISFDLPWHGKSDPPDGMAGPDYRLDSDRYSETIAAVIRSLDLDVAPVIVGASMAGAAVIEFIARHPGLAAGAVSCQAGPRVDRRHTPWLRNPRVNQTLHVPEWTFGLMSPYSPKTERDRVWWGYSQGGYGVYEADITYYSRDWDIENVIDRLARSTPPLALLSGVWDYSVPPSATEELAEMLPHARFSRMPELGHFPHAENPPVFAAHLESALEWIIRQARPSRSSPS